MGFNPEYCGGSRQRTIKIMQNKNCEISALQYTHIPRLHTCACTIGWGGFHTITSREKSDSSLNNTTTTAGRNLQLSHSRVKVILSLAALIPDYNRVCESC